MTNRERDPAQGLNAAVAAVLNGERVSAGMTFDQLAKVSGISKGQLMRLLSTTKRHIDLDVLEDLAHIFNAEPETILAAATERLSRTRPAGVDPDDEADARRIMRDAMAESDPPAPRAARKSSRPGRRSTN